MGLRPGQPSKAYEEGKMEKYNFKYLTPEQRKEMSRKGIETRKKNAAKKKAMKEQLEIILGLKVKGQKNREVLKAMGVDPEDMDNQMLLMAALFKKGLSGDTQAIKQICDTIAGNKNKDEESNQGTTIINIVGRDSKVKITNKKENDLEDEEDDER